MTPGMKELPILFSGPMIRAILDGRKTQTRRVVKHPHLDSADRFAFDPERGEWELGETHQGSVASVGWMRCPYGGPGDRLWVRETWKSSTYSCDDEHTGEDHECSEFCAQTLVYYAATPRVGLRAKPDGARMRYLDDSTPLTEWYVRGWRPSIHMPRWASRITLEVTDVRVERLDAITEEDAEAEGCDRECGDPDDAAYECASGVDLGAGDGYSSPRSYVAGFANLWERINGRGSWDVNPWVWVVGFRRLP